MWDNLGHSLKNLRWIRVRRIRMSVLALLLSLVVSVDVYWLMRQPGLTLAGDADCGILEHTHDEICGEALCICPLPEGHIHDEGCYEMQSGQDGEESVLICPLPEGHTHSDDCYQWEYSCEYEEHVHSLSCYSDETADAETALDWQNMFASYPYTGDLRKDLVGLAQTQVGYCESSLNFQVGADGLRRGYTRYGAWYGTPYRDWSAMFVSFCLNYAGADAEKNPGNTGADAMAELWNKLGKYAPASSYTPAAGDLVFFSDNTVGIVTLVNNASMYVICGDVDDAVAGLSLPLDHWSVKGWGITDGEAPLPEESEPTPAPVVSRDILDISNGPAVFIFEGSASLSRPQGRTLNNNSSTPLDLLAYLAANGGSYFYTLLDHNNEELPTDENGSFIVNPDDGYKLTISYTSPHGFHPGTYYYQTPDGLIVDGGTGSFVLEDGTNVGDWTVSDDGEIIMHFNEHMNSRTDITISATLGIHFPDREEPIDFDGQISVVIQKPPEEVAGTTVTKWGIQGSEDNPAKSDPTKLYWNVGITGAEGSNIVGSVIKDNVVSGAYIGEQHYTQSDMDAGLRFGASDPNWNWHSWTVYPGDENLEWTSTGWSYRMPETIRCDYCGEVHLGNNGWVYYVDYSSTPDPVNSVGALYYMNRFTADGVYVDGGANFTHGKALGEVFKNGSFITDASGGAFLWEIQAVIPGLKEGQPADYHWYLMDYMYLLDSDGYNSGPVENTAHLSTVTANYNGQTITVPEIHDATENDPFAWENAWSPNMNGIDYGREINLLSRCHCTEETCRFWENGCAQYWVQLEDGTWTTNGYCQCWTETNTTTFTFVYKTDDLSMLESYGGLGYKLQNVVELYFKPNGGNEGSLVSGAHVSVPIPSIFEKQLTQEFDGYTANYRITVNEAKLVLTNGSPLTIHDVMTQTLAYISGSLVITAEDAQGNVVTLQQDKDYTVSYDGTGNQTDERGTPVHVLDIVILHPQPVMYVLDYDTTLIIPTGTTQAIKYTNSASVSLWGDDFTDTSTEKVFADINISAKAYRIEVFKTSSTTGDPLARASFGLYNEHGGLITTEVSDDEGRLLFQTNIVEGIILREHILYYLQELQAPHGYQLDSEKIWFCFCSEATPSCAECDRVLAEKDALRIPFEQIGKVDVTNAPADYDLPATGGAGASPLILAGLILIIIPLVYGFIPRRRQERRGGG